MVSFGTRLTLRVMLCVGALGLGAAVAHAMRAPQTGRPRAASEGMSPPPSVPPRGRGVAPAAPSPGGAVRFMPPQPSGHGPIAASRGPASAGVAPAPMPATDPFGASMRAGMVVTGGSPHRLIMFSFDDGPDHRWTPRLLDDLAARQMRALFFLTASRIAGRSPYERRLADIARDIVRRGHFVGSHTMDHAQLPLLGSDALAGQIVGTERVFLAVLGQRPFLVRPPGGASSPRVDAWLAARGYTQMLWNLGTGDYQVRTADEVVRTFQRVLERRERENGERGGIVLLHDIHPWSVEAFPRIVGWLEQRNCELLRQGEELYDFVDDPAVFFVPRADASASDMAPPVTPSPRWIEARQAPLRVRTAQRCSSIERR